MTTIPYEGRTLLLVDDDAALRQRLARAFQERGFAVREADGVAAALALAHEESPELAVVDLRVPDGDGLEVVRALKRIDPTTIIVVLTGYGSIATALEAVRLGATHYLTKPADVDELIAAFAREERRRGRGAAQRARGAYARACRMGAHPARAHRLRRQRLGSGAASRDPPALAAAQAREVSRSALTPARLRQLAAFRPRRPAPDSPRPAQCVPQRRALSGRAQHREADRGFDEVPCDHMPHCPEARRRLACLLTRA